MTYMDTVLVQVHDHKDYVDVNILVKCFMEPSDEIKKEIQDVCSMVHDFSTEVGKKGFKI